MNPSQSGPPKPAAKMSGSSCRTTVTWSFTPQTVVSSGQTGELTIKYENAEPLGAFYFESGRLRAGQFQHLTGEDAFWQLFLSDKLSGTFSFSVGERPLTDWIESGQIRRSGGEMLITALWEFLRIPRCSSPTTGTSWARCPIG